MLKKYFVLKKKKVAINLAFEIYPLCNCHTKDFRITNNKPTICFPFSNHLITDQLIPTSATRWLKCNWHCNRHEILCVSIMNVWHKKCWEVNCWIWSQQRNADLDTMVVNILCNWTLSACRYLNPYIANICRECTLKWVPIYMTAIVFHPDSSRFFRCKNI